MVRAKFRLDSIKITAGSRPSAEANKYESCKNHELEFNAVYQGSEENKKFFNSTPSGKLTMTVVNEEAMKEFNIGKDYYVDFTESI